MASVARVGRSVRQARLDADPDDRRRLQAVHRCRDRPPRGDPQGSWSRLTYGRRSAAPEAQRRCRTRPSLVIALAADRCSAASSIVPGRSHDASPVSPLYAKVGPTLSCRSSAAACPVLGLGLALLAAAPAPAAGGRSKEAGRPSPDRRGAGLGRCRPGIERAADRHGSASLMASTLLFVCVAARLRLASDRARCADRLQPSRSSPISASPRRSASTSAPASSRTPLETVLASVGKR